MFNKIRNNKALKIMGKVLYAILTIIVLLLLVVVILQRVSNNSLSLGGFRIFNIVTGSMLPKYEVGDVLISKSIDTKELKVGDDVVYQGTKGDFAGKIVTHQIIDIEETDGNRKFHTKGLANPEEDPIVEEKQIIGTIMYKVQSLSYISKLMNNLYKLYFIVFIPVAILIFIEIRRVITDIRESKEEKEKEKQNKEKEDDEEQK